jgi:dTDP-N-acetylfucosamine:lipid II N-acetylfucosaminyltransferase
VILEYFEIYGVKNRENYVFSYIKFLFENLSAEEWLEHQFFLRYLRHEEYRESIIRRFKTASIPISSVFFFDDILTGLSHLKRKSFNKVIFHQLNQPKVYLFLFLNPSVNKKTYWMVWGGDLYGIAMNPQGFKMRLFNRVIRKSVISKLAGVIGLKEDYDALKDYYPTKASQYDAIYPIPSKPSEIDIKGSQTVQKKTTLKILVGHSANPANNHKGTLDLLKKYKNEDLQIVCPLSYGDQNYANEIRNIGVDMFGAKFSSLDEFMSPEEFAIYLNSIDVAVFNTERQSAIGIVITLLSIGKKVYYREGVSPSSFYLTNGITIFDTSAIAEIDFDSFSKNEITVLESNMSNVEQLYSSVNLLKLWRVVFDD